MAPATATAFCEDSIKEKPKMLTITARFAFCILVVLAACGSPPDSSDRGSTSGTESSSSGSSAGASSGSSSTVASSPTTTAGNCFESSNACRCSASSEKLVGETAASSCDAAGQFDYCCATEGEGGVDVSCRCYEGRGGKCLSTTRTVSSCSALSYKKSGNTGSSGGCQSDYDCRDCRKRPPVAERPLVGRSRCSKSLNISKDMLAFFERDLDQNRLAQLGPAFYDSLCMGSCSSGESYSCSKASSYGTCVCH